MNLTLEEFKNLIDLYINDSLTEEDLVFENIVVPMSAVIEAATILEDSYEDNEKKYLIKNIYDTFSDPDPISMEEQIIINTIKRKQKKF